MDQALVLEVPEIADALARVTNVALRDHPKCADGGERPGFRAI